MWRGLDAGRAPAGLTPEGVGALPADAARSLYNRTAAFRADACKKRAKRCLPVVSQLKAAMAARSSASLWPAAAAYGTCAVSDSAAVP